MSFFVWRARKYQDLRSIAHDERNRAKRTATRVHMYALEMPFSVVVGAVLGSLADKRWGIAPWGVWVGLGLGVAAAVRAVLRMVQLQRSLDGADTATEAGDD